MTSNPHEDEKALIQACAEDIAGPWEAFIAQYGRLIHWTALIVARRYGCFAPDIEDMAGHVYEKLIEDDRKRLRAWKGQSKFSTYLVQVVKNLCADYMDREKDRRPAITGPDIPEWLRNPLTPTERLIRDADLAAMEQGLSALPAKQAIILRMRLEGKSLRDIAGLLRIPEGTVAAQNSRAIARLRKMLTGEPPSMREGDAACEENL